MKNLISIGSLFALVLVLSPSAISQTTNSATQTIMFAVSRPIKPVINTLASLQTGSASSNSFEMKALQNQLKQQSPKVTVSASNSLSLKNVHLDLLSVLETEKSIANNRNPLILTITE